MFEVDRFVIAQGASGACSRMLVNVAEFALRRMAFLPLAVAVIGIISLNLATHAVHACNDNGGTPAPVVHFRPGMDLGVHVFTDANFTRRFKTPVDVESYVLKFFKSVFLRFRATHESLNLRLVNITVLNDTSVETDCFDYHDHKYKPLRNWVTIKYLHLDKSLDKFKKCTKNNRSAVYLEEEVPLIYVLTGHDTAKDVNGALKRYTGASQAQGGICTDYNVAIGRDDGRSYLGVLTAVRELGHLMGSKYDGWRLDNNKYVTDCHQASRHIMSYYENSQSSHTFSTCSKLEMEAALRNYTCKRSTSDVNLINSSIQYPGEGMSRDVQCKKYMTNYTTVGK
uniref:Salivary gland metalloprotease n=1 Tax=Ornithodoros brasiliensis TaxID=888526 RepID=A0A1D2AJJ5_ORNBR